MNNLKAGKLNIDDNESKSLKSFPNIAQIIFGLDERECAIVYALAEKRPGDTWEQIAKKLGLSRRQLFNLRCDKRIQGASVKIAREMLNADIPDVYRALTEKAKSGDIPAIRLFLELIGEFNIETKIDPHQDGPLDLYEKMCREKELRLENEKKEKRKRKHSINVDRNNNEISVVTSQ